VSAPTLYTIAPHVSFVDALARGLLARAGDDPLALARTTILLPTRRACRALREAFLRAGGGRALLLPAMRPLGDLDGDDMDLAGGDEALAGGAALDLAPTMAPLHRQLLLARLIAKWGRARGESLSADQAVRLAEELARLLDQTETEGLSLDRLDGLVPADYATHWQQTLTFLRIVTEQWPEIQAALGYMGAAARRRRATEARAAAWRRTPPRDPIVAAGSTGSIPATATLLGVIARLPTGLVVLPGLDLDCDDAQWTAIGEDPAHPQHGLAALLARLEVPRAAVRPWPEGGADSDTTGRARLVNAALAPAAATATWRALADTMNQADLARALAGVRRIDCPGPGEEATAIALVLRAALEREGRRAALVTPDRGLARRVAAMLGRWDVAVDDSAGVPLDQTPPGMFLRLTAEMMAEKLAPLALLAALKHPLAAGGRTLGDFRAHVRALERAVLRGPRPAPGFAGLERALRAGRDKRDRDPRAWLKSLKGMAAPFAKALRGTRPLAEIVTAHAAFAEALAASAEEPGATRLWAGDAGTAAAAFIAELAAAPDAPATAGRDYPAVLAALMSGHVVRPRFGRHPRLAIWGPLEARLQHTDVLVLGGLNEGTWPAEVDPGPWLSRPMRADFGLPPPERRIGLAAHDFTQAFCAPQVTLTRATRVDGAPTIPSRWLVRLDALARAIDPNRAPREDASPWLAWAAALDEPAASQSVPAPAPTPPAAARPRKLSITKIETWMRDPYGLYAREILDLRALDPIDADPGAAAFGTLVHAALERFVKAYAKALPDDAAEALIRIGAQVFEEHAVPPGVWAFWWPRFRRIAGWFASVERARRADLARSFVECGGGLALEAPGGAFTLTAKADRIDVLRDGRLAIIDYKTGAVPSGTSVRLGFSPQLPLEAAIAQAGGFAGVPAADVAALEYWRLTGGTPPGECKPVKAADVSALAEEARQGLAALVARFDDPTTPYRPYPRPKWAPRYSDYEHLARVKEWAAGGLAEDGE